jgi:hypothetical protein
LLECYFCRDVTKGNRPAALLTGKVITACEECRERYMELLQGYALNKLSPRIAAILSDFLDHVGSYDDLSSAECLRVAELAKDAYQQ